MQVSINHTQLKLHRESSPQKGFTSINLFNALHIRKIPLLPLVKIKIIAYK